MEMGGSEEWLARNLSFAISDSSAGLRSVPGELQFELNARRAYFACLRRTREPVRRSSEGVVNHAADGVAELIWRCLDPATSNSGPTSVEFVKLSVKAVLGLRDFIDTKPSPNEPPVIGNSGSDQLLGCHLVDAVTDIMVNYPTVPKGWTTVPIKPSITRILLWVWKSVPDVSISEQERREIFLSTCRLWPHLEKEVEF